MKFPFFVDLINFIGNFILNISKCFCVLSKTLKIRKNYEFHEQIGENGSGQKIGKIRKK